jgi:hypothetical protein
MSATNPVSLLRLINEIRPAIDVLRDPFSPARHPVKYTEAYRDLAVVVTNEDIWRQMFEIQPGCHTNNLIHTLGVERIKWLRKFREQEMERQKGRSA